MNIFIIDQNQLKQIAYKVCTIYKHHNINKSKIPSLSRRIIPRIYNSFMQNSCSVRSKWPFGIAVQTAFKENAVCIRLVIDEP